MKLAKIFLIILFLILTLTSCSYEQGVVLFNKEPVTRQNITQDSKTFSAGNRVYYIFLAPEKIKNDFIRVQIFKMTDLAPWGGNNVVRTKDCRLLKDEKYYHSDYFVLYEKGRYVMQIFSHDDFQHPIAINDFYIE